MPVDPRILQMISSPTGGKLTDIGQTYARTKLATERGQRESEELALIKRNQMLKEAVPIAEIAGAYTSSVLDSYVDQEGNPGDPNDRLSWEAHKRSMYDQVPEEQRAFIPNPDEDALDYKGFMQVKDKSMQMLEWAGKIDKNELKNPSKITEVVSYDKSTGISMKQDFLWQNGKKIKAGPAYADVDVTAETQLGKKAKGEVETAAIDSLALRDSLTSLSSMTDENKDEFTLSSAINSAAGNFFEYMGADLSDKWQKEINKRTTLEGKTKSVESMVRVATTGSAASAKELDEHIRPRVKQGMDSYSRARARLDALIEFEELTTVRMKQLIDNGYSFSKTGEGSSIQLIATKDGFSIPIQQASPLSAIPTYEDRRNQILMQKLQGVDPDSIPKDELKQMMLESLGIAEEEGYNVKARMR